MKAQINQSVERELAKIDKVIESGDFIKAHEMLIEIEPLVKEQPGNAAATEVYKRFNKVGMGLVFMEGEGIMEKIEAQYKKAEK